MKFWRTLPLLRFMPDRLRVFMLASYFPKPANRLMGTWALLQALRCDEAQGYFMARPMPEADLVDWAAQWTSPHTTLRTEFADLTT